MSSRHFLVSSDMAKNNPVKWPASEQVLAAKAVEILRKNGWEVYQEVPIGSARPDIVATRGEHLIICEVKTSFSMELLDQGAEWVQHAHNVYLVIPGSHHRVNRGGRRVANRLGLDVVTLWETDLDQMYRWSNFHFRVENSNPVHLADTRRMLHPRQKDFAAAGNNEGKFYSEFRGTCEALAVYVAEHPGCTLTAAVDAIKHHYSSKYSARAALGKWIGTGKIEGVEWRPVGSGKQFMLYPAEKETKGG